LLKGFWKTGGPGRRLRIRATGRNEGGHQARVKASLPHGVRAGEKVSKLGEKDKGRAGAKLNK